MFRHFLNDVEIFEPFGFDASSLRISQEANRHGRDCYLFSEDSELTFYNETFTGGLTHGFDLIKTALETSGADALMIYRLEVNENAFYLGRFDFDNMETDDETYYRVKLIDEGERFVFKRDFDTRLKIDRTPLKVLLKAKPVEQVSRWGYEPYKLREGFEGIFPAGFSDRFFNPNRVTELYGVKNSLIPGGIEYGYNGYIASVGAGLFTIVNAQDNLKDVKIKFTQDALLHHKYVGSPGFFAFTQIQIWYKIDDLPDVIIYDKQLTGEAEQFFNLPTEFNVSIPYLNNGSKLQIWYEYSWNTSAINENIFDGNMLIGSYFKVNDTQIVITATAIAINSVVETHRWTDLIDEVSNIPVDKPIFQSGFLYNTVLTNGYGIRSIRGKDFTTTPKAVYDFGFLNIDYQINSNNILIGTFEQFYPNRAIANIDELIAETSSKTVNAKFRITDVMIGFKKYEQDRDEQNTLDAVHTYSEWKTPNAFAQGKFERRTDIIFDVYKIESSRRLGFEDRTRNTSLDSDDDLFGFEITPIGSDNVQVYTGLFSQLTSTGQIKLLTNSFSWYSTGIEAGDSITITGSNAGTYTVDSINDVGNVITLLGVNARQNLEEVITITYTLNGVLFKSRTDEGYTSITGVSNPDNFGNLSYQQKKLLQRFSSYLATTTKYQTDPIRLVDFKSNRNLVVDGVADATDFTPSGIIISPYLLNLQAKLPFDVARNLLTSMVTRNNDGTIGGYVTVSGQSGWIKDMTYMFTPDECEVEMELELLDNQGTDVAYLLTESGGYLLQENNGKIEL